MGTTKKSTPSTETRRRPAKKAATPEQVLGEAVEVSAKIKAAPSFTYNGITFTNLGQVVKYALTIADPAEREAFFAALEPFRDIVAFDFYSKIGRPLEELQAASAAGNKTEAAKAADDVAKGLADFAEISPEFRQYVGDLEERIVLLGQAIKPLQENDKVQDRRLDHLEDVVARMLRGQFVDVANLPWEDGKVKAPAQPVVPPQAPAAITDAQSRAAAHGTGDDTADTKVEQPEENLGFFAKIARAFRLGAGGDDQKGDGYPYPGTYAGPIQGPASTTHAAANNGPTQGKE